ncbi:MFS transporter [Streptomyces sp. NPDC052077]|uniref:MFS transporter n=1 Tax=Streptomyces sp. NPDC052077 TaxID=3154757 RepID=UPI003428ED76
MTGTEPRTEPAPGLRHNRTFQLLWTAQALSDFGSSMSAMALPLVLLAGGSSSAEAAVIGTAMLVVGLVVRIPAGYLSDHRDQRVLMVGCDLARLLAAGVLALCLLVRPLPLWLALAAVVVSVTAVEVFRPSQQKVLRWIVDRDQLPAAISLNQARSYGAEIAAPAVAGFLLGLGQALPFAVDAVTFGVSALCVAAAPGVRRAVAARLPEAGAPATAPGRPAERFWPRLTAGFRYLGGHRPLLYLALYFSGVNLGFSAFGYVLILGVGGGSGGATAVGAAMSTAALAGLCGSLIAPRAQRLLRMPVLIMAGPAASALLLLAAWRTGSTVAVAAGFSALCLLTPVVGVVFSTIMATSVPEEVYGRVNSSLSLLAQLPQCAGPMAAGLLLLNLSLPGTAAVLGVLFAGLAVVAPALPDLTRTAPDAPAGEER